MLKADTLLGRARRQIPFVDALLSLVDQLGLKSAAQAAWAAIISATMLVVTWLYANLPWWTCTLIALATFAILAFTIERILRSVAYAKAALGPKEVDRIQLADECDRIAAGIMSLLSEHIGSIQAAWWGNATGYDTDIDANRNQYVLAQGKLIEKFGERYYQKAWAAIHAASKVIDINRSDIWPIQHGMRNESDLNTFSIFLTKIASDLRYGQKHKSNERESNNSLI